MTRFLMLSILVAAAPPAPATAPSSVGVHMYQAGRDAGIARSLNIVGGTVTCDAGAAYCTIFVDGGGGAPTNAQYWVGAADGTLTAEKNLGALATGLVINTAGVPSAYAGSTCGAGQYASAASASGALTCAVPPGTPGGSSPQVQYNNAGAFGGMSKLETDGTRPRVIGETSHPATPGTADSTLVYDWLVSSGAPTQPMRRDNAMGLPMPAGLMSVFFSQVGTAANWRATGCAPLGFGIATLGEFGDTASLACSGSSGSCSATAPAWATTDLYSRSPVYLSTKTAASGSSVWCGLIYTGTGGVVSRGVNSGEGGFIFWTRAFFVTAPNDTKSINKTFVGLVNSASAPSGSTNPSAFTDTVYFGNDVGEAQTLRFCTNDNSGSATCHTNLGANFPIQSGAWYDFYIWAPPAASAIYGAAVRLDSAQNSGLLTASSDLPRTSVQMTFASLLGSGGADAGVTAIATSGAAVLWNY